MPRASNDATKGRAKNKPGYIAGTNFPTKPAHKEQNGVFWLQERRLKVAKWYLEGRGQWEIARELGIDQATVSSDIGVVMKVWKDQASQSLDTHKQRELAKIDNLERIAVDEYVKSMGIKRTKTRTIGSNGEFSKDELKITTERRLGDTRYLDQIKWCIEMRCKILGITKESKDVQVNNLMTLNWEQIVQARSDGADINKEIRELELLSGVQPNELDSKDDKTNRANNE